MLIVPLETNNSEIYKKHKTLFRENAFENIVREIAAILSRGRWVKPFDPIVNVGDLRSGLWAYYDHLVQFKTSNTVHRTQYVYSDIIISVVFL